MGTWILGFNCMFVWLEKMVGKAGGLNQIGKKVKGKQGHSSIQPENGLETQMTRVIIPLDSFALVIWVPCVQVLCVYEIPPPPLIIPILNINRFKMGIHVCLSAYAFLSIEVLDRQVVASKLYNCCREYVEINSLQVQCLVYDCWVAFFAYVCNWIRLNFLS